MVVPDATTRSSGYYCSLGGSGISLEEVREDLYSSLAAVEEAGGEEDDGDHEGQAGVLHVVHAETEHGVCQPSCEAQEPYPCRLSHHAHAPERGYAR